MQPEGRMKELCILISNKSWILDGIGARGRYRCESDLLLLLVREFEAFKRKHKVSWIFCTRREVLANEMLTLVCSRAGNEATRCSNVLMACLLAMFVFFW